MRYLPIKFKPIFKQRIWGSDRLKTLFGKELPPGVPIGESWELADLPDNRSQAANGPLAGMDIRQILEAHGKAMGFTDSQIAEPFGLLIKILDANDTLSVQVHPDQAACTMFPGAQMKTECWFVIDAQPDSILYIGLKPGIGKDDLKKAIENNTLDQIMQAYPARKGDFHFLPAGTIHAIGAGIIIAETHTPSDSTYRVYDWDRTDSRGRRRQLHIDQALASIHFTDTPPTADNLSTKNNNLNNPLVDIANHIGPTKDLLTCPYFP